MLRINKRNEKRNEELMVYKKKMKVKDAAVVQVLKPV